MALRLEVCFIDESDSVNKRKGFIVKDNPDWEIDSSISLDLADSLDDISDFEEELKSAESNSVSIQLVKFQVQALHKMTAATVTTAITVKEPRLPK